MAPARGAQLTLLVAPHVPQVVGLDLGTSACKAALFELDGRVAARVRIQYPTYDSAHGAVEQRPADWWTAACSALKRIAEHLRGARVVGIGLSGQIGTHVLLDRGGAPLHDAVTWQDTRSARVLGELSDRVDTRSLAEDLRTWLPSGPAWPLPRMLWLRSEMPELLSRASTLALPKDYIVMRLCGEMVSDASSWRGIARPDGRVVEEVLAALDLPNLVPKLLPPHACAGVLRSEVAELTGLPRGTPVFVGWNDFNCSLLGAGVVAAGQAFDVAGTSEHIGLLRDGPIRSDSLNSVPYMLDRSLDGFAVYGVSSNGGGVADWLSSAFLSAPPGRPDTACAGLESMAAAVPAGSEGLMCLPYLRGERAPVWDAQARGAFVGLRSVHRAEHMVRAALEGVAFNLRQIYSAIPATSPNAHAIRLTGGPAAMHTWNVIKASVLRTPIAVMTERDAAALGAGMLAVLGSGTLGSATEAGAAMTAIDRTIEPDPTLVDVYSEMFEAFLGLYSALAPTHAKLRGQTSDA